MKKHNNLKQFLLMTALVALSACECGDKNKDPKAPLVFVFHHADNAAPLELTDGSNIYALKDLLHAHDNKDALGEFTREPHRIDEKSDHTTLPDATSTQAVYLDVVGTATQPTHTTLNKHLKLSSLYLENATLTINESQLLQTLACVMANNTQLTLKAALDAKAVFIKPGALVIKGENLRFLTLDEADYGTTVEKLKTDRKSRFAEIRPNTFMIGGIVDTINLNNANLKVSGYGNNGWIATLNHTDGTLGLRTDAPLTVTNYNAPELIFGANTLEVLGNSVHALYGTTIVFWNTTPSTPLMSVINSSNIQRNLYIKVTELSSNIPSGSTITLMQGGDVASATYNTPSPGFGATFEITKDTILKNVNLTVTRTTPSTAGLSLSAQALSRKLLAATKTHVGSRLVVMPQKTAITALNATVNSGYLSTTLPLPATFNAIHAAHTSYVVNSSPMQNVSGLKALLNNGAGISVSVVTSALDANTSARNATAATYGASFNHKNMAVDVFTNPLETVYGSRLTYATALGYADLTYFTQARNGTTNTELGTVYCPNVVQHRVTFNLGTQHHIQQDTCAPINLAANAFVDVYNALGERTLYINTEDYTLPLSVSTPSYGVQLQASVPVAAGYLSAACRFYRQESTVTPEVAFAINLNW
jgi:hypothetical protein